MYADAFLTDIPPKQIWQWVMGGCLVYPMI